jgi:hypothetical protein
VDHLAQFAADQIRDISKSGQCDGVDLPYAKLRIYEVNSERRVIEQSLELLGAEPYVFESLFPKARKLEVSLHSREELFRTERLYQVVVSAMLQSLDARLLASAGG